MDSEELKLKWSDIEAKLLPLIEAKARGVKKFVPNNYFDYQDIVQEGRIALLEAYSKYKPERGEFLNFASVVLNNRFKTLIWKMLTQRRTPRSYVRDGEGWAEVAVPPLCLDLVDVIPEEKILTNEPLERKEIEICLQDFNSKMLCSLKGNNKKVFQCMIDPPPIFGENTDRLTNKQMSEYLGINLNAVLWSISQIRMKFTEMARQSEHLELWGNSLKSSRWPMVHMSKKSTYDSEFVKRIMKERKLDLKPIDCSSDEDFNIKSRNRSCFRFLKKYKWGTVLYISYEQNCRTCVIEGNFSPHKGIVIGKNGAREKLAIPWYKDAIEQLER